MRQKNEKMVSGTCETCEFYDYDEEYEVYTCSMRLDEDEMRRFMLKDTQNCPYYRFYDEYKSVHKQI